jgi:alanine-glyoxylate transaminase/serine-glyoxylate transaminase/serine-pyruvate transaminase
MLPDNERVLLGPGPSLISPRVTRALAAPMLSHLDPQFLDIMDDVRARLSRVFQAPPGSFALAVSGTGTSAMETAVANLVDTDKQVLSVVTGYFGDRLAEMCRRYGAAVRTLDVEWGRAVDPDAVTRALRDRQADLVTIVHAETSTGVLNPVQQIARIAHEHGALVIVDAVTSLGAMPLDVAAWDLDVVYSCSQKGLGAPSGVAPIVFTPAALGRRVTGRSFYFDLALLEDYWVRRKYHHTMCASLVYALREALLMIEEEGLSARWSRHERHHDALVSGLDALGLSLLPPPAERLWTLNAVRVPPGVDDAAVRKYLLQRYNMEIGAGLGPLAGKVWRVGLMGTSSTIGLVTLFLSAIQDALKAQQTKVHASQGISRGT